MSVEPESALLVSGWNGWLDQAVQNFGARGRFRLRSSCDARFGAANGGNEVEPMGSREPLGEGPQERGLAGAGSAGENGQAIAAMQEQLQPATGPVGHAGAVEKIQLLARYGLLRSD